MIPGIEIEAPRSPIPPFSFWMRCGVWDGVCEQNCSDSHEYMFGLWIVVVVYVHWNKRGWSWPTKWKMMNKKPPNVINKYSGLLDTVLYAYELPKTATPFNFSKFKANNFLDPTGLFQQSCTAKLRPY